MARLTTLPLHFLLSERTAHTCGTGGRRRNWAVCESSVMASPVTDVATPGSSDALRLKSRAYAPTRCSCWAQDGGLAPNSATATRAAQLFKVLWVGRRSLASADSSKAKIPAIT